MKELSSSLTFFYKFVFLFLWILGFGYGTKEILFLNQAFDAQWWQYFSIWLGVTFFISFTTGTIKRVAVEQNSIVVSNFFRSETIAFSQIKAVDGSTFLSPKLIWFTLKEKSSFGKRISFLPKHRMGSGLGKHPLVHELKEELNV